MLTPTLLPPPPALSTSTDALASCAAPPHTTTLYLSLPVSTMHPFSGLLLLVLRNGNHVGQGRGESRDSDNPQPLRPGHAPTSPPTILSPHHSTPSCFLLPHTRALPTSLTSLPITFFFLPPLLSISRAKHELYPVSVSRLTVLRSGLSRRVQGDELSFSLTRQFKSGRFYLAAECHELSGVVKHAEKGWTEDSKLRLNNRTVFCCVDHSLTFDHLQVPRN